MTTFPTAQEAVDHFAQALQDTVSCVTPERFQYPQAWPLGRPLSILLAGGTDVPLDDDLYLYAAHRYVISQVGEDSFAVQTAGYMYDVDSNTASGELYSWQWHPSGQSHYKLPHANVHRLHGTHFPTSRVAIEQVVRWLIAEAGVAPRIMGWEAILDAHERDYRERRSWA